MRPLGVTHDAFFRLQYFNYFNEKHRIASYEHEFEQPIISRPSNEWLTKEEMDKKDKST
jgi:hypothetical protein